MKKGIIIALILWAACMVVIGWKLPSLLMILLFLSGSIMVGLLSFYFLFRQVYRVTSKATRMLKRESHKAFTSLNLFYRLEKVNVSQGVKQLHAVEKKVKLLLRLIRQRFAEQSLTALRFREEVESCAQKIIQNLGQIAYHKESLSSVNPGLWQDQLRQLQRLGVSTSHTAFHDLQQNLKTYESMGKQCKELLSENDQLLAQMDEAIIVLNRENYEILSGKYQHLLPVQDSFIYKFLKQ